MARQEHYKRQQKRDNISKLLKYIKERNFASFSEMKAFLNVSGVTLTEYLGQLLEDKKIIHCYRKEEGQKKQKKGYQIRVENRLSIDSQIGKYEAIRFIEGIPEPPTYSYRKSKDGRAAIGVFADSSSLPQKTVQFLADRYSASMIAYFEKARVTGSFPVKTAIVIMFQAREVSKK